ncbi:MAG: efflux RND transporter periplasmic adaptor subunit, partial [Gemmatimonadota bacterium]
RRTLSMAVLRSPIAGVVSLVSARLNASVDPSQPLVEVVDPSEFDILFHLSTGAAARVRRGDPVRFSVEAETGGGGEGTGSVVGLGARVDSIGSVEVRVRVSKVSWPLWAGQSVRARIQVGENPHAVVVPSASVVPVGDSLQVFVVDSGGIAHRRPVSVGARTGTEVEILTGLRAGEVVAAEGAFRLQEGARVRRADS